MLSIIIPCYNGHELTRDCITAVAAHTADYEIVLVDNGSTPPISLGEIPNFVAHGRGQVIRNATNLGFPVAVNQGIRAAKGDVIVLLNNDVIVTPGWAERLLYHLETFTIVGPLTNYCAGMQRQALPVYEDGPGLDREAVKWRGAHAGQSLPVRFVIGFCMAFRRSLFDAIGPFDESLWPCSGEEIDFCLKAREAGHAVGIARDVYVHHHGSQTFQAMQKAGQMPFTYVALCIRNDAHLAERYGADFWQRQGEV